MIHFIADVHLGRVSLDDAAPLYSYLTGPAQEASALYILGDLFDYWLGKTDRRALPSPYGLLKDALRTMKIPVYFVRGNRDFLMDEKTAQDFGMTLLPERSVIEQHGQRCLILHGDELCTADRAYQRFRSLIRHRAIRLLSDVLPPFLVRAQANALRKNSMQHKESASLAIMDVTPEAVQQQFRQWQVPWMVHGHTHRPAHHQLTVDGSPCERWVLGSWDDKANYLAWGPAGMKAVQLES